MSGDVPVIFDSGCIRAVSPFTSDLIGQIAPVNKLMNGLGAKVKTVGEGTILWSVRDDYGVIKKVKVKAYHAPASKVRLLSPQ